MEWIENGCFDDLTYASFELKKYHKHLMRLQIQKGFYCDNFLPIMEKYHTHKFVFGNIYEKKSFTEYIIFPREDILVLLEQQNSFANDFIFLDFQNI